MGSTVAGTVGVGLVALTRVGHPWHVALETDLPAYEAFVAARVKPEFRSRQRFKLRMLAKWSRTIRKYGFYERDPWTLEESALADRLLEEVSRETNRQRRATGTVRQPDAWIWPDHAEAPWAELLARAVARVVDEGVNESDARRIADRLADDRHRPAVLEAAGCLIPRELNPVMDGVMPRGRATPGGTAGGVSVAVDGWNVNVGDERSITIDRQPLSKGVFEMTLIVLRRVCSVLRLEVTLGTSALGQLVHSAKSAVEVSTRATGWKSWVEPGGLREKFLAAKEVCLPILVGSGKLIRDCLLVFVRSEVSGVCLGEAESLCFRVYDPVQRYGLAKSVSSKIESLFPRPACVREGRNTSVEVLGASPDSEHTGDVACFVLGLAVKFVAGAAGVACSSPDEVGFAYGLRHRLSACVQELREEAYRRGVRDAVRAAVRDDEGNRRLRAREFFQLVLRGLATSSSSEGDVVRATSDLSVRALREVKKKVVGMQGTHVVTWNIAGHDVAKDAMEGFGGADKVVWLRSVFDR